MYRFFPPPTATLGSLVLLSSAATATAAASQIVPVRTVPVASGDQWLVEPSARLGMGGLEIALDDSLADGWSNPGKGINVPQSSIFGAPTFYGISDGGGGGITFPVTGILKGKRWFGGASVALQEVDNRQRQDFVWLVPEFWWDPGGERLSESSSRNFFASGYLGSALGDGPWSLGLGFSAARLRAMDGVDLLYAGSDYIGQSGSNVDLRAGAYRAGGRDRLGITLAHHRVSMTHEVGYTDWIWPDDFDWESDVWIPPTPRRRIELNEDRTRSWGVRMDWDRTLNRNGWRTGTTLTVNLKDHPKIPNYSLQNIPRDPGTTWAFEAGYGVSRTTESSAFGVEVGIQPIWSNTWQEADMAIETAAGGVIAPGGRTIDNDFDILNAVMRVGAAEQAAGILVQLGLEARSYGYRLVQRDNVEVTVRNQEESWMEWTPSWGVSKAFSDLEARYTGRATFGTGQPGIANENALDASGSDFVVAPEGPLTLFDVTVVTHQFWVRVPIR